MASGSVVRYTGKQDVIYRIKYRDAAGLQIQETLGTASEGWTQRKAEHELRSRLTDVHRDDYRRPTRVTFASFAERFLTEYLPSRNLKLSTVKSYRQMLAGHLVPHFGPVELASLAAQPERIDAYVALKTREGLSPKTIANHLTTLSIVLKRAVKWKLIKTNPVLEIDRPASDYPDMNVLTEDEIAALLAAIAALERSTTHESVRAWWLLVEALVRVALGTALRRGELLALRWRDLDLDAGMLTVREAYVLGQFTTPKSRTSRRRIEVGPMTIDVLAVHKKRSSYNTADDLVFCHPEKGTPLDPSKTARVYIRPALKAAGIVKPFRPFHDLRHTALTHEAAAGNPQAYIQMKAGHSQGAITERYIHAAQVEFAGAAARAENRMFGNSGAKSK